MLKWSPYTYDKTLTHVFLIPVTIFPILKSLSGTHQMNRSLHSIGTRYYPITFLYSISTWKEGKKGIFKACCKPWSPKPGSQFSCPRCDLQSIQSIHKKCSFRLSTMLSCAPCLVLLYHKVSQRLLLCPFNKFKGYLDVSSLISTQKRYGLKSYFFRLG